MNILGFFIFFTLISIYFLLEMQTKDIEFFYDRRKIKDRRKLDKKSTGPERRVTLNRRIISERRKIIKMIY